MKKGDQNKIISLFQKHLKVEKGAAEKRRQIDQESIMNLFIYLYKNC